LSLLAKRLLAVAVAVGALTVFSACVSDTSPVDKYRCRKQADCPEGRVCYLGYCDPDPDAGNGDVSAGGAAE
jgi:hypothetical protein